MSVEEVMQLVRHHVGHLRRLTDARPETKWALQYSPETFCMTELEVSLQACTTALEATVNAVGGAMRIVGFEERSIGAGADAQAWALVEASGPQQAGVRFGAGRHADITTAGGLAVLSAAVRLGLLT